MCLAEARHIFVWAQSEHDGTNTSVMRHKIRAGPAGKHPKKCVPPSENVHKDAKQGRFQALSGRKEALARSLLNTFYRKEEQPAAISGCQAGNGRDAEPPAGSERCGCRTSDRHRPEEAEMEKARADTAPEHRRIRAAERRKANG